MSGRNPPLCCTLTLIAMQGHKTKTKQKYFECIIKCVYSVDSIGLAVVVCLAKGKLEMKRLRNTGDKHGYH